jgi:hypothetical protein
MPLIWTIDYREKIIRATASGPLNVYDLAYYMAGVQMEGAEGYRAIFDATAAVFELTPADLGALSQEVQSRRRDSDGAIAVVAKSAAEREMAEDFVRRIGDVRQCKLFETIADAERWLESLNSHD